jgi:hypothetical protein
MAASLTAVKKEFRRRMRTILSDVSDAAIALQSESKLQKLPSCSGGEIYSILVH